MTADNPTPASGAVGERGPGRSLAAYRRHRPNPFVDVAGGDGATVDGAAVDDGDARDGDRGSLVGGGSREDRAFRASRGSPASPANRSPANASAAIADDVAAAANDDDDAAAAVDGDGVEVAPATGPDLHPAPRHYSAMDGLGLNGKPLLSRP